MNVRYKKTKTIGFSGQFNLSTCGEVLVYGEWGSDSSYIKDLDVEIDGQWVDMNEAFTKRLIIPDDHNVYFAPPVNDECRERGYNP